MLDPLTKQLIRHVERLGYAVMISVLEPDPDDPEFMPCHFEARDMKTRDKLVARGEDPYLTACELAVKVGIEPEG